MYVHVLGSVKAIVSVRVREHEAAELKVNDIALIIYIHICIYAY